jgi:hypothetical protein
VTGENHLMTSAGVFYEPITYLPWRTVQAFGKNRIIYDAQNPDVGLYVVIVGRVNQLVDEMIFLQKTGPHLSHREAIFRSRQSDKPCAKLQFVARRAENTCL